jgi:elongation factor Ts
VEGRLEKFFKETCLLEQQFIKNPDISIQQLIMEHIAKLGENINVRRFVRYELGEGLAKRQNDCAVGIKATVSLG